MSLQTAKALAGAIHRALLPHEEAVYKLEDVLLFFHPPKAAILFVLVNLAFLGIYYLGLTAYSVIFLVLAAYHLLPTVLAPVVGVLSKLVLADKVCEVPADSKVSRYNIAELSAFIGTVYYVIEGRVASARRCLKQKEFLPMFVVLFMLMFLFYLFLSFNDTVTTWFLVNGALLLPFASQMRLSGVFDKLGSKVDKLAAEAADVSEKKEEAVVERSVEAADAGEKKEEAVVEPSVEAADAGEKKEEAEPEPAPETE